MNNEKAVEVLGKILKEYESTLEALPKTLTGESWLNDRIAAVNIAIDSIQKQGWNVLPCRLPEDFKNVRIQFRSGSIVTGYVITDKNGDNAKWYDTNYDDELFSNNIVAWKHLSEPTWGGKKP